jgi:hypothetical protein
MRKVSQLKGKDLDKAVAQVINSGDISPSTNWAQGGPIIHKESIYLLGDEPNKTWLASTPKKRPPGWRMAASGTTPLIAAMRAYVVASLGEAVRIPETFATN